MGVEKINVGNFFSKNLFMLQRAFKFTMTLQMVLLLSLFIIFSVNTAQAVTTGTIDGTYDFGTLGAADSGGTGFKTQGDKHKISNALLSFGTVIYFSSTNTGTFTIKAEGGSTMKTCTVTDLVMGMAAGSAGFDVFTITYKDYFGTTLGTHTMTSDVLVVNVTDLPISNLTFDTPLPAGGYDLVAEINIYYLLNQSTSNFEFRTIDLSNISASVPASNTAPTVSGTPASVTVTEDTLSNINLSTVTFADADADNLTVTMVASAGTFATPVDGAGVGAGVIETLVNATTITLAGSAADINTYLDTATNIKYTGASNVSGTAAATITISATDGIAPLASNPVVNVDISAVNDDPTNSGTFPTDIAVTEDVAGNVDLSGMTLADVDSAGSVVVTLTATGGTLTATTAGGVTIGGSGTGTLTLTGTITNIDTFLNTVTNIKYTGAANANGADAETVAVKINDNDGSGDVALGTFNLDIAAVNDTPTLGGTFTTAGTVNDNATITLFSGVTVSDVEADNVSITITYTGANGTLTGTGITGTAGNYTLTLAALATVQTNLQGLTFTPTINQVAPASTVVTTFTLTPSDAGSGSADATTVVTATSINDNPTLIGEPTDITATEDVASNVDLSSVSLADVDVTGADFTLVITAGAGTLTASSGGGVTVTNSGTGAITLTGTPANIDTYLNTASNIKYTGAANANGNDATTLTLTVNDQDGSGNLNLGTVNLDITAVNDAAGLNLDGDDSSGAGGNNYAVTFFVEGAAVVKIADTDTVLTDVDDTNMETAIIALAGTLDGANEGISISGTPATMGGVTITYSSATRIDLSGSATLAEYQAVIEAIEYNNLPAATGGARTVSVTVNDGDTDSNTAISTITVKEMPTITSATYDASTGQLVITGTDFVSRAGVTNDLIANRLTITGENGTYTLTDTANVEISSGTAATVTLSATDKLHVNGLLNRNGTTSVSATYNLAAADGWMPQAPGDESDFTGNGVTVSNVAVPTITSATYDSDTGVVLVTGTNFSHKRGANNDIDLSTLTFTGGIGNATYTVTSATDVEITSATSFTFTLSGADKTPVDALLDQIGTASSGGSTYNIAAADGWLTAADAAMNIADATAAVTVSINPKITSSAYNASTGSLVVTGTNIQANGGGSDIDASLFTFTGESGATYTLTDTSDVERDSVTQFTLTLSATDKAGVNQIVNKNGISSTGGTTYNLAAADDWDTNVTAGDTSDPIGNGITVSNVAVPTITSATYDGATGTLVVTGTNLIKASGFTNDIDASLFTFTGEGSVSHTLTDTADVEISSGTGFTMILSAADKSAVNLIVNKVGTSSDDSTPYNLGAAEDWAAGADGAVIIVDATGNGITASNVYAIRTVASSNDSGPGSLRQAIIDANPGDSIDLSSLSGVITLTTGEMVISKNLTISGPTANSLIISGNNSSRVLNITSGTVSISYVAISDGNVTGNGAGILNAGTLSISNSTINNNASIGANNGGGLYNDGGTMTVTNSTVSGNSADNGGGVYSTGAGTLTLANSTFSDNTATAGGGINNVGNLNLENTIIANSTAGGDCVNSGSIVTNTNNLVEDNSCSPAVSGDPAMGGLTDNGGPTLTHALMPGSSAIDSGDNTSCETIDQRGNARPADGDFDAIPTCDIGAYEYIPSSIQFSSATYVVAECSGSAAISLTRAGGTDGAVSVDFSTADGTATAGSDYITTSGTLSWASGDNSAKTFTIPIIDDISADPAETVDLNLSNYTGAIQGTPSIAQLTITNNNLIDSDLDGMADICDDFPGDPSEMTDTNGDGIGNNADPDDDGDGILDIDDAFPLDATPIPNGMSYGSDDPFMTGMKRSDGGDSGNNLDAGNPKVDLEYEFRFVFKDATSPASVKLLLDGHAYEMNLIGGTIVDGALYSLSLKLGPMSGHSFHFEVRDGGGLVLDRLPAATELAGPVIELLNGPGMVGLGKDMSASALDLVQLLNSNTIYEWVSSGLTTDVNNGSYGALGNTDYHTPGQGYFVVRGAGSTLMDLSAEPDTSGPTSSCDLSPGWNMISNPYGAHISLIDVQVQRDDGINPPTTDTWATASSNRWVTNSIYTYLGSDWGGLYTFESAGGIPEATLVPWTAYWVYVIRDDATYRLIFTKP